MVVKGCYAATASILPSLLLVFSVGFSVTCYQLNQEQINIDPLGFERPDFESIDFEPIETALLAIEYTHAGVVLSEPTERALRQAVLAFPDELSDSQLERIKWLAAQVNPLHGKELAGLLVRYQQYMLDAQDEGSGQVSGVQQLQRLIRFQHQYFGAQTARGLFPSQHALLDFVSARASTVE